MGAGADGLLVEGVGEVGGIGGGDEGGLVGRGGCGVEAGAVGREVGDAGGKVVGVVCGLVGWWGWCGWLVGCEGVGRGAAPLDVDIS